MRDCRGLVSTHTQTHTRLLLLARVAASAKLGAGRNTALGVLALFTSTPYVCFFAYGDAHIREALYHRCCSRCRVSSGWRGAVGWMRIHTACISLSPQTPLSCPRSIPAPACAATLHPSAPRLVNRLVPAHMGGLYDHTLQRDRSSTRSSPPHGPSTAPTPAALLRQSGKRNIHPGGG